MYTKFKECLLKPSQISKYVYDKTSKLILYFLLIALIYLLPSFVQVIRPQGLEAQQINYISSVFEQTDMLYYEIAEEDGKHILRTTRGQSIKQYLPITFSFNSTPLNVIFFFDYSSEKLNLNEYNISNDMLNSASIYVHFSRENITAYLADGSTLGNVNNNGGMNLADSNTNSLLFEMSYDEIGFSNINFTNAKYNTTIFKRSINDVYLSIYSKHRVLITVISIPTLLISGILSLIVEVLVLALVLKLVYHRYQYSFGALAKIAVYAYTPRVVFNLLSIFWASTLLYFIGQLLTVIYMIIALRHYALEEMARAIGKNIIGMIEKDNDDKGE